MSRYVKGLGEIRVYLRRIEGKMKNIVEKFEEKVCKVWEERILRIGG